MNKNNIPYNPNRIYSEEGWSGWGDFLGLHIGRTMGWLAYEDAKLIARQQKFYKKQQWFNWQDKPNQIPIAPDQVYREWEGWEEWLGYKHHLTKKVLTEEMIIEWSKQFIQKYNCKPSSNGGIVEWATDKLEGITWKCINLSLIKGRHGLQGSQTLSQLLKNHLNINNRLNCLDLQENMIIEWAMHHIMKYKKRPSVEGGTIEVAKGDYSGVTWTAINNAFRRGKRGLPKYKSLAQFLNKKLGHAKRNKHPMLSDFTIKDWIKQFKLKYGYNPRSTSGKIEFAQQQYKGITWRSVDECLRGGYRGLSGGSSLAKAIDKNLTNNTILR